MVIESVLAANADANLFDMQWRSGTVPAQHCDRRPSKAFHVITGGLSAMLAALGAAGRTAEANRAALANEVKVTRSE